ncbi:molybdopterin-dependent oxidoreductase [Sphingomonas sp.]|uniref:molybdopterin-dependent oxidoreductase n=1 Tax=Sphingomonas sp. TaxID=28214 RepID=UPI001E040109|nr:molybdopterin-dependent oxidoreductase [Sphingomonas sp.]MBX9797347.1 molybdopterin-dependent oxidoreductase [Sphingomonas sp.]
MAEVSRRAVLGGLVAGAAVPAWAQQASRTTLGFANGERLIDSGFPEKGPMIVQRTRAPLLETPFEVFDRGIFTPNDQFYVRWHYQDIPLEVNTRSFRLTLGGAVARPLSLSLAELLKMPRVELAAVNQCSGNSRGFVSPRVAGAQWGHGAMGNARWLGVPLRHLLDLAGVKPGAVAVRFAGLDQPPSDAPAFVKSLAIDHARDGEVMVAFAMNGTALPMLNGFPLRLVVPGWYSTYWVKALDRIEVLTAPDDGFWMSTAYKVPTAPYGSVAPGLADFPTVPISRMVPRSFITNLRAGARVPAGSLALRGIAFGGASAVQTVELSMDRGARWLPATLGPDQGRYGFRGWQAELMVPPGVHDLSVRCTAADGQVQRFEPVWNPGGYMLSTIETISVTAA